MKAEQLQEAAAEGYKSVLNLRLPEEEGFMHDEQQHAESAGLQYVNIPVKPDGMTDELTDQVLAQIDQLSRRSFTNREKVCPFPFSLKPIS